MAKKELDNNSLIHFELTKLEEKVKEFQDYLEYNSIVRVKNKRIDDIELSGDDQDKLHKEILVQIKMQDALFSWMPNLLKLREVNNENKLVTRGNQEVNGMFKRRQNG